jgi:uncharacterized membrane protein YphA (DoxX/SURF4 family)
MKKDAAYHILRVGTAITFLWIGVLIFRDPVFWGGFLKPWAANLLPVPVTQAMIGTAVLDIIVGFFLLIDVFTWIAAALASAHLLVVLTTAGIDVVTVRDIGLLAGSLALFWGGLPMELRTKLTGRGPTRVTSDSARKNLSPMPKR